MARNKNTKAPFFFPSEVNATNILKGSSKLTLDPTTEFLGKTYEAQVLFPFIVPAGTPNLPPMPGTITSDRATGDTDASNNGRARIACFARITSDPDTHIGIPDPRDINVHKGIKQNFMKYAKNHPIYVWGYAGETSNNTLGIGDVIQVYHSENYHEEYGRIIERIGISKLDDIPWLKTAKGMFEGRVAGPLGSTKGIIGKDVIDEIELYNQLIKHGIPDNLAIVMVANAKEESMLAADSMGDQKIGDDRTIDGFCSHGLWQMNVCGDPMVATGPTPPGGSPRFLGAHFLKNKIAPNEQTKKNLLHNKEAQIDFMANTVLRLKNEGVYNAGGLQTIEQWNDWFVRVIEQPDQIEAKISAREAVAHEVKRMIEHEDTEE